MAEELNWELEAFDEAFREAFQQGMVKADFKARVVWIPNAIKHNRPESPNVVKSWVNEFDLIPECALKQEAIEHIKASIHALGEAYGKAFDEAFAKALVKPSVKASPKTMSNQEQEQEQDKKNPPLPPKGGKQPRAKAEAIQFKTFVANCKAKGESMISGYAPIFEYAQRVGLPTEFVQLAWFEFGRQMGEGGVSEAKRQADWRKTFRNYVEKNYLKLWWLTSEGKYELTNAGKVAERANAERLAA